MLVSHWKWRSIILVAASLTNVGIISHPLRADVKLASIFTDHMVLQRQIPIVVWGTAAPGEAVKVTLAGDSASVAAAADGKWRCKLPAMEAAAKPLEMVVQGKNTITLTDVLLGEVWICSGQSNMGRPVGDAAAKAADQPQIRLFNDSGETPRRDDLDEPSGWVVCTPKSILTAGDTLGRDKPGQRRAFSEVAYHFGLKLHQELKVPIGLIQVNCGGSTAVDWSPLPGVEEKIVYDQPLAKLTHQRGLLYWIRVRPLLPLTFRGVIWYQGEDDGRNPHYGDDLKNLIEGWRETFGREFPFFIAQIQPTTYAGGMLSVWEGQQQVVRTVPNTALAVSNDIYDGTSDGGFKERIDPKIGWPIAGSSNPHPTGRPKIAARLADIALVETYKQPAHVIYGPIYESSEIRDDKVLVKFKHSGGGLATRDEKTPDWFEVSDGSQERGQMKYVHAQAKIVALDTVEVSAPEIKSPKYVRFGWNPLARFNLINKEGLPAVSFRTEPTK